MELHARAREVRAEAPPSKNNLNLVIANCFKAPYDRGSLRLKDSPNREFKATIQGRNLQTNGFL